MTDETKMIMDAMGELKREIKSIQLTLENETNRNIKLIAEGQRDLGIKLDVRIDQIA